MKSCHVEKFKIKAFIKKEGKYNCNFCILREKDKGNLDKIGRQKRYLLSLLLSKKNTSTQSPT